MTAAAPTAAALTFFRNLAAEAGNWKGEPPVHVSPDEKEHLSELTTLGLIVTYVDGHDCAFAILTAAGRWFAVEHGIRWAVDV